MMGGAGGNGNTYSFNQNYTLRYADIGLDFLDHYLCILDFFQCYIITSIFKIFSIIRIPDINDIAPEFILNINLPFLNPLLLILDVCLKYLDFIWYNVTNSSFINYLDKYYNNFPTGRSELSLKNPYFNDKHYYDTPKARKYFFRKSHFVLLDIAYIFYLIYLFYNFCVSDVSPLRKKILNIDENIIIISSILYFTGWSFYVNYWRFFYETPEFMLFLYPLPGLFICFAVMPFYYFYKIIGFTFKNKNATSLFLYELMFDCLNIFIFGINILIYTMLLLFIMWHYAIWYYAVTTPHDSDPINFINGSFLDELNTFIDDDKLYESYGLFFSFVLPNRIQYCLYEFSHFIFCLVFQFHIFILIALWLSLFLLVYILSKSSKDYFYDKRLELRKYYKNKNNNDEY